MKPSTSERASNRAVFPIAAALVDHFRVVFGADVRLLYARENGNEIGTKPDYSRAVSAADMVIEPKKPEEAKVAA